MTADYHNSFMTAAVAELQAKSREGQLEVVIGGLGQDSDGLNSSSYLNYISLIF
jgi:hypothetical protein